MSNSWYITSARRNHRKANSKTKFHW